MLKLRDWIDINKIEWYALSVNKNALNILNENQDKINWNNLNFNENAMELLKKKIKIKLNGLNCL